MSILLEKGLSPTKLSTRELLQDDSIIVGWELEFIADSEEDEHEYDMDDIAKLLKRDLKINANQSKSLSYKDTSSDSTVDTLKLDRISLEDLPGFFDLLPSSVYAGMDYDARVKHLFNSHYGSQRDQLGDNYSGDRDDVPELFEYLKDHLGALKTVVLLKLWPKLGYPGIEDSGDLEDNLERLNIRNDDDVKSYMDELSYDGIDRFYIPGSDPHAYSEYTLTLDGSVNGNGYELVSPKQKLTEALSDISRLFEWLKTRHFETDTSTGFHVSMSYGDASTTRDIDTLKLAVLLGEEHILDQFGRLGTAAGNRYAPPQMKALRSQIDTSLKDTVNTKGLDKTLRQLSRMFHADKHTAINISKLKEHGYIEFRIMGGQGYHERFEEIKKTILQYALAVKIALDPQAYRKEYLKKIYVLLDRQGGTPGERQEAKFLSNDQLAKSIYSSAREPAATLSNFKDFSTLMNQYKKDRDDASKARALNVLLDMIKNGMPKS